MSETEISIIRSYPVRIRVERYIAANYQLHASRMQALSFIYSFLKIKGKEQHGLERMVDWSGARYNWLKKFRGNITGCIEAGVLERVPAGNGPGRFAIRITQRGYQVLAAYNQREREILSGFLAELEG